MEGRNVLYGVLTAVLIAVSVSTFYTSIYNENDIPGVPDPEGLNMTTFRVASDIVGYTAEMKNKTTDMEDVTVFGDIVAIVGSGVRAVHIMLNVPGLLINMVGDSLGYFHVEPIVATVFNGFIWVTVVFIIISVGLRYRT